jgi:hypothetical protein
MGYAHIDNLYKNIDIMQFKECYAMEKIHGTSAHIAWKDRKIRFFAGGGKHDAFVNLFEVNILNDIFMKEFDLDMVVYGESYGGKQQGMSSTYGKEPAFIVFDVKIGTNWLNVPDAKDVATMLGLEFVSYIKISTDIKSIDSARDLPSVQAVRNGMGEGKKREGIVLRPLVEFTKNNGKRVISKHKGDEFIETKTPRAVDPEKLRILKEAKEIADEWVTPMRLGHVLDKLGNPDDISETGKVIKAMIEDVFREASGEIVESRTAQQAIGKACAILYKSKINKLKLL